MQVCTNGDVAKRTFCYTNVKFILKIVYRITPEIGSNVLQPKGKKLLNFKSEATGYQAVQKYTGD